MSIVVNGDAEDIHVSGHARQEELKLMLALTKPRFFMPVHGEFLPNIIFQRIFDEPFDIVPAGDVPFFASALTKPRFFMPVHGEFMHLSCHRDLALSMGMDKKDIFVMKLGDVLEVTSCGIRFFRCRVLRMR